MSEDRDNRSPYAPGSPDPTLLTREESQRLEERMRRESAEKISALKELHEITFKLVGEQITQARVASEKAVDAALANQKEAASKIEASLGTQLKELDRRITESTRRLDAGEGIQRGSVDTRQERRADLGTITAIVALAISVINIIIMVTITLPHSPAIPVTVTPPPQVNPIH